MATALLLTSCLSRPALMHQTFALETPTSGKVENSKAQGVLAVRAVVVSPFFETRAFMYRVGPDRYQADPYAGFIVPPSRALGIPIRACLRNSGAFEYVVEPGSQLEADTILEVHATELYGDFRKPDQLAAVLSLRFLLISARPGEAQALLSQKDYSRRVPLKEQTAAALVAGWNQALAETMQDALADLTAAQAKTARSPN